MIADINEFERTENMAAMPPTTLYIPSSLTPNTLQPY